MANSSPTKRTSRPRLSLAMIARDEADVIGGSLECVRAIVDEIIVVDTGSKDRTRDIAVGYGAQVIERPWDDDFSAARNSALAHATGDWILLLDAGEQLAAEAAAELRRFVETQADTTKVYLLAIQVPAEEENVFGEEIHRLRLIPNHRGLRFVGRVREDLQAALEMAGMALDCLPWKIQRSAREHDPQIRQQRAQRNLKLAELEMRQHGWQARLLCAQGEALGRLREMSSAAECYRHALQLSPRGSTQMLEAYYGLLTTFDGDATQRPQQLAVCIEALEVFPFDAQLHCAMGSYLQAQGRLDLAARSYQLAVEHGRVDLETWHLTGMAEVATVCWSLSLQLLERDTESRQVLEDGLTRDPSSARLRRHLINLHIKHDRRQDALAQVNLLPPDTPHREALRSAVRGGCLAARQNWIPALSYLRAAYTAGCRDAICLRWLCVALLAGGDVVAAEPIMKEWQALEPRNPELIKYLEVAAAGGIAVATPLTSPEARRLRVDREHAAGTPALGESPHSPAMPLRPAQS